MNLQEILTPPVVWFILGFIFLILEFAIPGLIIIFFGVGAWLTALTCLFGDIPLVLQLGVFISTSVLSLVVFRKELRKRQKTKDKNFDEELEEFVGKRAIAQTTISKGNPGKVAFKGTDWVAESDDEISKGQFVQVIGKDSLTLIVKQL